MSAKLKTIHIPKELTREGEIREETVGEKKMKRVSISSDTPYLRYDWYADEDYWEVLSHEAADIDDSRLKLGLPMLFNHRRDDHLGRATKFHNDGHRIDVGILEDLIWSEGQSAQVRKKDVESGALVGTSVGYSILDDGECIGAKDGVPIYKFKWAPHEFSFCTIEADTTVGAGRGLTREVVQAMKKEGKDLPQLKEISVKSQNAIDETRKQSNNATTKQKPMAEEITEKTESPKVEVVKEADVLAKERNRVSRINGYVASFKVENMKTKVAELAVKAIEGGQSYDDFRQSVLDNWSDAQKVDDSVTGEINMSKKELRRYSIAQLLRQAAAGKIDDFYKEKSGDVAKLTKRDPEGIWIPDDVSGRSLDEIHGLGNRAVKNIGERIEQLERAMTVSVFSAGGALVGTDLLAGSLIQLLLNKVSFLNGFIHLGGLVGNVAIPKVTGGQTAYWLPEGGTVTASQMVFAQLGLLPHRLVASTAFDKQLVAQASLSVEALVRDTIARIMAVEKNRAMINGSGSSGEPLGLLNITGVQSNDTTANAPTWAQIVNFETKIGTANADLGPMSWLYSPAVQGNLKSLPKIGTTFPIFMQEGDKVNGYPVNTTNNVPSGLGIFGVGSEFIVADWAGIDIVVNPYSLDTSGQIRITVQMWTDNGCRHEVAFVVSDDTMAAA